MAAKPDLIVDFGSISDTYISLADRVQSQTAIPYLLIDGRFAHMQAAVRLLGGILGVTQRADQLAGRMEDILHDVDRVTASIPREARPRVYLARGTRGLETGNRGSTRRSSNASAPSMWSRAASPAEVSTMSPWSRSSAGSRIPS